MKLRAQQALQKRRRSAFSRALRNNNTLEVILETAPDSQKKVAKKLKNFTEVKHVYENIPYVSIQVSPQEAAIMRESIENHAQNEFREQFSDLSPYLRRIEVAAPIKVPTLKKASTHIWNLERIGAYDAQMQTHGNGITVGIIDTGIDTDHPELQERFGNEIGYDFVEKNKNPKDEVGHGTHVAGIVAGQRYGVAPSSQLYSLRVLDKNGEGFESDTMAAIDWAISKDLDIVNLSLGAPFASQAFEDMCYAAAAAGLTIVAAAGNSKAGPAYPAAFGDPVIAVAATDRNDKHPAFSNIYDTNDISAPGVDVVSSVPWGYEAFTGTSMASPHVAGSLALAKSVGGSNLEQIMKENADPLGPSEKFGAGMVQVDRMVEASQSRLNFAQYGRTAVGMVKQIVW